MPKPATVFLHVIVLTAVSCDRATTALPASAGITAETIVHRGQRFRVMRLDAARVADLRLYWRDEGGLPFGDASAVARRLQDNGERLVFATNAGIFHPTRTPVGLHIEHGNTRVTLNSGDGQGNFFLKPNGVFSVSNGRASVRETSEFDIPADQVQLATQSGPLLLRRGRIHPGFEPSSNNRRVRSAVGVSESGQVVFVLSEGRVTFHELGSLYRDALQSPDALYLDGDISKFYAPQFGWNEPSGEFAGLLAVVERGS